MSNMIVKKTFTKTYELCYCLKTEKTIKDILLKYNKPGINLEEYKKCFACEYEFSLEEIPFKGMIKGSCWLPVCNKCAEKVGVKKG